MAATGTECESFFENKVNSMLVTTSWIDELKALLEMEAVSQIWGDAPAWYMWLSDAHGVYRLQLEAAMNEEKNPANKQGYFSIKCYPFDNTTVFDTFSYEEQVLSQSRLFDDTHTPRFEELQRIPDSLFNVAAMIYRVNQDDTMACFTLESLDTLRCVYPEETVVNVDLIGKTRCYRKGEIGRSVPGWQLGYPVFDRLLGMYAHYSKAKPARVRITRSSGFEYVHAGDRTFNCLDAPKIHRLAASVLFASPDRPDKRIDSNELDVLEPEGESGQVEILLDRAFPCGHHHHAEKTAPYQSVVGASVNPLWWSLAETAYASNLASTCGCH
ncbi:hypothetical protein [Desulfosarcina sp.]|uniref:hypothetical protein n=1 Tax=Desulfosarcina sp. TaxID=2027861 RepID=UPI0035622C9F